VSAECQLSSQRLCSSGRNPLTLSIVILQLFTGRTRIRT